MEGKNKPIIMTFMKSLGVKINLNLPKHDVMEATKKACFYLIASAVDMNADQSTYTWERVSFGEKEIGTWRITVEKQEESKHGRKGT